MAAGGLRVVPHIAAIVRNSVGRRRVITRRNMAELLVELCGDALPSVSSIYGGKFPEDDRHMCGGVVLPALALPHEIARAVSRVWSNTVKPGVVVSAWQDCVRCDDPAWLSDNHMAPLGFAAEGDWTGITSIRRHALRTFVIQCTPPLRVDHPGTGTIWV